LRVVVKRMTETKIFEDELKQVKALNENITAHNQELEHLLAKVGREKSGKYSISQIKI
jgi:uncharacterized small protein (DUF1192 family)